MGRALTAVAMVGLLVLSSACREGIAFRRDDRLSIVQPDDRVAVALPFQVTWSAHDLPDGTRFAVLIDRAPPPAGEGLDWLARHDPGCTRDPACPDRNYLGGLHVHVTDATALTVGSVPRSQRPDERELHHVTVILLDREGNRVGETAETVTLEVRRER